MDQKETAAFGRNCLLARRLVERGVRFIQLYHGAGAKWDSHQAIEKNHSALCRSMDRPVAGLLKDLRRRGLLDETLVIWGGEFGRTPMSEKGDGRDHNPYGFTMWMAGAGLPGGRTVGATDEVGLHGIEDRLHVHDLHATILHLLGIEHSQLVYRHKGRPERPTLNEGEVAARIVG
jgi:arylsulfatase A-like enzyme